MKSKFYNEVHVEGKLYDHDLEKKVSGASSKNPGTEYISGIIKIATDDECLNVVEVHYSYVTETNKKGVANKTYLLLNNIIEDKLHTVVGSSKAEAALVKVDSAIALNDFYTVDKNTNKETLVSVKRIEGGFLHSIGENELNPEKSRSSFRVDMVITGCTRKEANEEKNIPEKVILKGGIFDFKKSLLPIELSVLNSAAMDYFEGLDISNKSPVVTQLKGKIVSETVIKTITEESAFGDPSVRTVKSTNKDYVVNWAAPEPYEWDDESSITAQELQEAMQEREVYLADVKRRAEEYKANKNNALKNVAAPAVNAEEKMYNF